MLCAYLQDFATFAVYLNALKARAGAQPSWQTCEELHTCIHLLSNICDPFGQQILVSSPSTALCMTAGIQLLHRYRHIKELLKEGSLYFCCTILDTVQVDLQILSTKLHNLPIPRETSVDKQRLSRWQVTAISQMSLIQL